MDKLRKGSSLMEAIYAIISDGSSGIPDFVISAFFAIFNNQRPEGQKETNP
jgi:hypothetical protein